MPDLRSISRYKPLEHENSWQDSESLENQRKRRKKEEKRGEREEEREGGEGEKYIYIGGKRQANEHLASSSKMRKERGTSSTQKGKRAPSRPRVCSSAIVPACCAASLYCLHRFIARYGKLWGRAVTRWSHKMDPKYLAAMRELCRWCGDARFFVAMHHEKKGVVGEPRQRCECARLPMLF